MKNIISTLSTIHTTYKYCQAVLMVVVTMAVVGVNVWKAK